MVEAGFQEIERWLQSLLRSWIRINTSSFSPQSIGQHKTKGQHRIKWRCNRFQPLMVVVEKPHCKECKPWTRVPCLPAMGSSCPKSNSLYSHSSLVLPGDGCLGQRTKRQCLGAPSRWLGWGRAQGSPSSMPFLCPGQVEAPGLRGQHPSGHV